jgi:hypothetical protein
MNIDCEWEEVRLREGNWFEWVKFFDGLFHLKNRNINIKSYMYWLLSKGIAD